jgi:hypothetical protein
MKILKNPGGALYHFQNKENQHEYSVDGPEENLVSQAKKKMTSGMECLRKGAIWKILLTEMFWMSSAIHSWKLLRAPSISAEKKPVLQIRIRRIRMFSGLPDPDPLVPGTYGSGSGSGSFYHQDKIVRKTLIPNVL